MAFGCHLTIDCYKCNKQKIDDLNSVYDFLNNMPKEIGMNKISRPFMIRYEGGGWDKGGICGFVFIAESHISIHTFPAHDYFTVDVYSCNEFDAQKAAKKIAAYFDAKVIEKKVTVRGISLNKEAVMEQIE